MVTLLKDAASSNERVLWTRALSVRNAIREKVMKELHGPPYPVYWLDGA
jgi:hypothetical protein